MGLKQGIILLLTLVVLAGGALVLGYFFGNYLTRTLVGGSGDRPSTAASGDRSRAGIGAGTETSESSPPAAGDKPAVGATNLVSFELPAFTWFRIQLGAFGSAANAEKLAEELRSLGLPAYVTPGLPHLVEGAVLPTRDAAANFASSHLGEEREMFIRPAVFAGGSVTLKGGSREDLELLANSMKGLAGFLQAEVEFLGELVQGAMPAAAELERLTAAVRETRSALISHQFPAVLGETAMTVEGLLDLALQVAGVLQLVDRAAAAGEGLPGSLVEAMTFFTELAEKYLAVVTSLTASG